MNASSSPSWASWFAFPSLLLPCRGLFGQRHALELYRKRPSFAAIYEAGWLRKDKLRSQGVREIRKVLVVYEELSWRRLWPSNRTFSYTATNFSNAAVACYSVPIASPSRRHRDGVIGHGCPMVVPLVIKPFHSTMRPLCSAKQARGGRR